MSRQMFPAAAIIAIGFGTCIGIAGAADKLGPGSNPPSLNSVTWAGQGTNFESLKGKTVVVLTYVTWCPICNGWSGEALRGLNKAIADKPVIVLAISTDTPPAKAVSYMKERQFVGPKILHGYDPSIAKRMGFTNEFFNYAIIGPDSKIAVAGNAGTYRDSDGGKVYSMGREVGSRTDLGQYRFLTDDMSDNLKELVFPMELGILPSAAETAKLKRSLKADDRQAFEKMLDSFLDQQLEDSSRLAEGEVAEKLSAFDTATYLSVAFKGTEHGQKAKKILTDLNKDKDLKKELAAKRQYDDSMKLAGGDPARQTELLRGVTKKFPGTHYAKLAGDVIEDSMKAREENGR